MEMYSAWEPTATLPSAGAAVGPSARGASASTEVGDGAGVYRGGRPATAYTMDKIIIFV